jgi:hypothetical protein
MKKIAISMIVFAFLFSACGKKEASFEAFSAEAFAYKVDNGWEVNASSRVKGFMQNKEKGAYLAKLSFTVDLVKPDGSIKKSIFKDVVDEENSEEFMDLPAEAQIELDSSYPAGKYAVIFNIQDQLSKKTATIRKEFDVTN